MRPRLAILGYWGAVPLAPSLTVAVAPAPLPTWSRCSAKLYAVVAGDNIQL